ncbi:MAG: hypothetical protein IKN96_03215 [Oscillibacter sp.]|nr:hypothetical protein [Oscillibacter sp.]
MNVKRCESYKDEGNPQKDRATVNEFYGRRGDYVGLRQSGDEFYDRNGNYSNRNGNYSSAFDSIFQELQAGKKPLEIIHEENSNVKPSPLLLGLKDASYYK